MGLGGRGMCARRMRDDSAGGRLRRWRGGRWLERVARGRGQRGVGASREIGVGRGGRRRWW